jgi:predicted Zn-dependent protease
VIVLALLASAAFATSLVEETKGVVGRGMSVPVDSAAAMAAVEAEAWDDAATQFEILSATEPDDPTADLWWAVSLVRAGRAPESEHAILRAMAKDPSNPTIYLTAAWSLYEAGAPEQAEKIAKNIPAVGPDHVGAIILRIRSLVAQGKPKPALRLRAKAQRQGLTDAWFWLEAGVQDSWLGRDDAPELLERGLRAEGTVPSNYLVLMRVLIDRDDVDRAIATGRAGIARFPDDLDLVLALGEILLGRAGRPAEALDALADHVGRHPEHALAWRTMARAYRLLGDADEEAQALRRAIDAGASEPALFQVLAKALQDDGNAEGAIAVLEDGLRLNPDERSIVEDLFAATAEVGDPKRLLRLAQRLETKGQVDARVAEASFHAAIKANLPSDALHWAQVLVGLVGETDRSLDMLARAYWDLGELQRAVETERRAVALSPGDPGLERTLERYERGVRSGR